MELGASLSSDTLSHQTVLFYNFSFTFLSWAFVCSVFTIWVCSKYKYLAQFVESLVSEVLSYKRDSCRIELILYVNNIGWYTSRCVKRVDLMLNILSTVVFKKQEGES